MKKFRTLLAALAFGFASQAAHAEVISLGSQAYTNTTPTPQWQFSRAVGYDILVEFTISYTGTLQNNDFAVIYFGNTMGPNIGLKTNCDGACTNDLFVRMGGTGWESDNYVNPSDVAPLPQTYHLFGRLSKQGGSENYNRFDLWLDPTEEEKATLTGWNAFAEGDSGFSTFNSFGVRTANLDRGDTIFFSDLTITAVPEPGTVSLLGLAVAGLAATRRRKARRAV